MPEVRGIEVRGTVQGVGFRPFVYRLATVLGVRGSVRNVGGLVAITAAGPGEVLDEFAARLVSEAPPRAAVTGVTVTEVAAAPADAGFTVLPSGDRATVSRDLPPDLATCDECLRELFDPGDRRYRYPFVNCVNCGPRTTIIEALPYDRERTTMRSFAMCAECAAEYNDPADRRFHAEPTACPACGPRLRWTSAAGAAAERDAALPAAVTAIRAGGIVAVKGIGGYQLICAAGDADAVARLRVAKGREGKPLAVMVRDLAAAGALAHVTVTDAALLTSPARPITLLPRRAAGDAALAPEVCAGVPDVGVFLPYSPLHHLLLAELDRPLVVTSGNRADGPIVIDDEAAVRVLGPLADGLLGHDRRILARYDDSVVRTAGPRPLTIRRARGYAPEPLPLPASAPAPVLAVGAQLKHTFALAVGERAVLGPHTGDLEDAGTLDAFERSLALLRRIQDVDPEYVAHDLHPEYLSTKYATTWPAAARLAVQHHHAHVAATAAEHGVAAPFLGVAFDGLGLGDDGTFWGGEVLLATYTGYRRLGRFARAPLPGGAAAVRRPARMALGYLFGAEPLGPHGPDERLAAGLLERLPSREVEVIRRMVERGLNAPLASSAGRLFDAMAALLGLRDTNRYEGDAAIALEAAAAGFAAAEPLAWRLVRRDGLWVYDSAATLREALEALAGGVPSGRIAAAFHETVARVTVALCERAAADAGVATVCLSGGVFQNRRLATAVPAALTRAGFDVYVGERVPMNDGGISYGQAAVAAARLAGR
ncbi:MAG TPA: carbamoyltransferase HypF [Streptosporangiaceae bacterium]|nr:carbamoyltransferase HypF [Streptosporangiaceae bacterium]